MFSDQMGENFGVGGGLERVPGLGEPLFEALEILDDPVVNDGDSSGLIQVRVGILVRRRAVRGPAGVPDAQFAGDGLSLERTGQPFIDLAFLLSELHFAAAQNCQAGAVVTPVFQAPESFQEDRRRWLTAHITHNATHDAGDYIRSSRSRKGGIDPRGIAHQLTEGIPRAQITIEVGGTEMPSSGS